MAINFIPKIEFSTGPVITINFSFPPNGFNPKGRRINQVGKLVVAANGQQQSSNNYQEETRRLRFRFITKAIIDEVETFFIDHFLLGEEFKYFENKDEVAFNTYVRDRRSKSFQPRGMFSDGNFDSFYEFSISMRRVL